MSEIQIPLDIQEKLKWENLPCDRDGVLMLWQRMKERIETAKNNEMELRKFAVSLLVPEKKEGMNTVELGNGYQAKAQIKYNYVLADNDTVEQCLNKISKVGNKGSFIADRLVSWKPNFLLTEFRQLCDEKEKGSKEADEILNIVNEMLTITEAAPTLDIKEPKKK